MGEVLHLEEEEFSDALLAQYTKGLVQGSRMVLDLILGENTGEILNDEIFEDLKFDGVIEAGLEEYLTQMRDRQEDRDMEDMVFAAGKLKLQLEDWGKEKGE